ncbi:hypothetical protein BCEP27_10920 [Burkholderia cepacia]
MLQLATIDIPPLVLLLEERLAVFDLNGKHLPSHRSLVGNNFKVPINPKIMLLVVPLKQPLELLVNYPRYQIDAAFTFPSVWSELRKALDHDAQL